MSTPINDGGPAFPGFSNTSGYGNVKPFIMPSGEVVWQEHSPGMTLRDWFAGQALAGFSADMKSWRFKDDQLTPQEVARMCYVSADAMLAARAGKETK
jgi:hypothetical protein